MDFLAAVHPPKGECLFLVAFSRLHVALTHVIREGRRGRNTVMSFPHPLTWLSLLLRSYYHDGKKAFQKKSLLQRGRNLL